jgi:iron(III) transport system substrate-binding protein
MNREIKKRGNILVALTLAGTLAAPISVGFAEEAENIWRELANLSGQQRENTILSGAKKEGQVVYYSNIGGAHLQKFRDVFEKRYPEVKLEIWQGTGEKTANRLLTEGRAGKFTADVVGAGNEHLPAVLKAGLVGRYDSPERKFYSEFYKDREGYWTSHNLSISVIAYNTALVFNKDAPRKYEDFLNSKWRGNFALDMNPDKAVMAWLKLWGYEKTEKFMASLVKNDAVIRGGHSLLAQLLCAGEFKVAMELYANTVAELKEKGCPVEMIYTVPAPAALTPSIVTKRAPHPYAAALLLDFLLSESGAEIMTQVGRISARRGMKPKYPDLDLEGKGIRVLALTPEDADRFGDKYQQLRKAFLIRQ